MDNPLEWITPMSPRRLRVLIIDGHPAVGRGLKALVDGMPGLDVVGPICPVARGLRLTRQTPPDVVLIDADLPGLCSLAAIALLRSRLPRIRIVALGIYPHRRRLALAAGADEFVLKDAGYEAIQAAIAGDAEQISAINKDRAVRTGGERESVAR